MERYFFYAPVKKENRKNYREKGFIAFQLCCLFGEKAISSKERREITSFKYIDQVDIMVSTRAAGMYRFKFDHGKDGAHGHWVKKRLELIKSKEESGFQLISEKQYFRIRKLALKLMFRHTNFAAHFTGRNEHYWSNETYHGFYHLRLASLHYHHRMDITDYKHQQWRYEHNITNYQVQLTDKIDLFLARQQPGKDRYESYKFSLEGSRYCKADCYSTHALALDMVFHRKDPDQITRHQYERLRKIAKHLIWECSELDISAIKKKQTYFVRILDI